MLVYVAIGSFKDVKILFKIIFPYKILRRKIISSVIVPLLKMSEHKS